MNKNQKFQKGDLIRIAKVLPPSMTPHFPCDCEAIVIGSYDEQFGRGDIKSYTLYLKEDGEISWYDEDQFTLIERARLDLLQQWEDDEENENREKGDLDWIFEHDPEVLQKPHAASIAALAKCFGLTDLWGSHGEGTTAYLNSMRTLMLASPFLQAKDKKGWLEWCSKNKYSKG